MGIVPTSVAGQLALAVEDVERSIDAELAWNRDVKRQGEWRYANLARLLSLYEGNQFWRARGFSSMNEFLNDKADRFEVSRGTMYSALWVGQRLGPYLTDDQMKAIGKSKLLTLSRMTHEGTPPPERLVELALSAIKCEDFEARCMGSVPLLEGETHADLDVKKISPFFISAGEKEAFDAMLALARRREGVKSRNRVFAMMIEICLAHWTEEEVRMLEEAGISVPISQAS